MCRLDKDKPNSVGTGPTSISVVTTSTQGNDETTNTIWNDLYTNLLISLQMIWITIRIRFDKERLLKISMIVCFIACSVMSSFLLSPVTRHQSHRMALLDNNNIPFFIIPPKHFKKQQQKQKQLNLTMISNITLRDYIFHHSDGIHLAMAPSFFGFYGYFGVLAGLEEELALTMMDDNLTYTTSSSTSSSPSLLIQHDIIKSVVGASAGAMAAILLAAGISPIDAATFCTTVQLQDFMDFPGLLSVFQGNKFENIMEFFLTSKATISNLQLENGIIPVAVTAFDLQSMQGQVLNRGNMARAARASACFPILFQPVGWINREENKNYLFVDGGIQDTSGLEGLAITTTVITESNNDVSRPRIVNLVVGDFHLQNVRGPLSMPYGVNASSVLSISIQNLPVCGPWAMENGPIAVQAARNAIKHALDVPLFYGQEDNHYVLYIDASSFI